MNTPPPPEASPGAAAAWLQLQRRFQAGLAERAHLLQAAANRPAELHGLLHRLVGAAGAYGDHDLAQEARELLLSLSTTATDNLPADTLCQLQALCLLCRQRAQALEAERSTTV